MSLTRIISGYKYQRDYEIARNSILNYFYLLKQYQTSRQGIPPLLLDYGRSIAKHGEIVETTAFFDVLFSEYGQYLHYFSEDEDGPDSDNGPLELSTRDTEHPDVEPRIHPHVTPERGYQ
jgi:hypothetical protein